MNNSDGSSAAASPAGKGSKGGRKKSTKATATAGASSANRAQIQKNEVTYYGVHPLERVHDKTTFNEMLDEFKKDPNNPLTKIPLPLKDNGVCFDFAIYPQVPGMYQGFAGKGKDEVEGEKDARRAAKKDYEKKSANFAVKGAKALLTLDGNASLQRTSGYCGFTSYTAFATFLWDECKSEVDPSVETLTNNSWLDLGQSFDQGAYLLNNSRSKF